MLGLWLFSGIIFGACNILILKWTIMRFHLFTHGQARMLTMAGFFLRLGLTMLLLVFALRQSIIVALAVLFGMGISRWTMVAYFNARARSAADIRSS